MLTTVLLLLCAGHRSGRIWLLGRAAAAAERATGLPGWTALPSALAPLSLLTALFGMYWDIALHIDVGRDTGPLDNPAHYLILVGLFGIFSAGVHRRRSSRVSRSAERGADHPRLARAAGRRADLRAGAFALAGFPLDDGWHRLFGQDVTLWGPTHLMLIGGAVMTLIGIAVLQVEGGRAQGASRGGRRRLGWLVQLRRYSMAGGLLIGLSTFQGEFDYGVPQFRLVFGPVLIMFAAGVALVAMRALAGPRRRARRGGVLPRHPRRDHARGRPGAGRVGRRTSRSTSSRRCCVEGVGLLRAARAAVALRRSRRRCDRHRRARRRVGLVARLEPDPVAGSMLAEGALLGFAVAIGGAPGRAPGSGARLARRDAARARARMRAAAVAGAAVLAAVTGYCLYTCRPARRARATSRSRTRTRRPGGQRTVNATVRARPAEPRPTTPSGSRRPPGRAADWWSTACARPRRASTARPADPGPRRLEGADPAPRRPLADSGADLPAGRSGDPGSRRRRPSRISTAHSSPTTGSSSASAKGRRPP